MVDSTIYGYYIGDGVVVCASCYQDDDKMGSAEDGNDERTLDGPDADQGIYSHNDTEREGLTCDTCYEYIFEPDPEYQLQQDIEDILLRPDDEPYYKKAERIISALHDHGLHPGV
jgi:hypothetical protein